VSKSEDEDELLSQQRQHEQDTPASELTDELARKYEPDRLLTIVSKRAGRGDPLEHSVRTKYERRFGVDLRHVRIYTGEFAEEFNRKRGAHAVTVGSTGMILMGRSADKGMASASGQALLAHELTHVAQQARHAGGGLHRKATFSGAMPFAAEHEAEAEAQEQQELQQLGGAGALGASVDHPAMSPSTRAQVAENLKEQVEKVKARVLELVAEAARMRELRSGSTRRV
jgi:hypothetical protein